MPVLVGIFLALIVLSFITVAAASIDFGELNLFVALGIATVKATLVALFFMHLAHDRGFNTLAFFGSFFFVTLFVGITLMDSGQYQASIEWKETVLSDSPEAK
jgi:cytochrome c oxidase subunit 4